MERGGVFQKSGLLRSNFRIILVLRRKVRDLSATGECMLLVRNEQAENWLDRECKETNDTIDAPRRNLHTVIAAKAEVLAWKFNPLGVQAFIRFAHSNLVLKVANRQHEYSAQPTN